MPTSHTLPQFCGNPITPEQRALIQKTTERFSNLSRTELATTLCEWLDWVRPNGKPMTVECWQFLDKLEQQQQITLPQKREKAAKRNAVAINLADPQFRKEPDIGDRWGNHSERQGQSVLINQ